MDNLTPQYLIDKMTEKELRADIGILASRLAEGEGTAEEATRLNNLRSALSRIENAKDGRGWL